MILTYPAEFIGITQGYKASHLALDLGWNNEHGGKNCNLYASGDGVVTTIRDGRNNTMSKGDSGNYVTIKYSDGYETRACHMEKGSICVKPGDKVTRDTIIGKMGNSGYCTSNKAYHCHFIVWKNGVRVNPLKHLYVMSTNTVAKSNTFDLLIYKEESFTKGKYITKEDMKVRTNAGTIYPLKLVKQLTEDGKLHATSKNPNDYAIYKKGTIFTALEIINNKYGIWAKTPSGYVCIKGASGKIYCERT